MKKTLLLIGAVAASVAIAFATTRTAVTQTTFSEGAILPYLDQETVEQGALIYAETCASCHGDNLEGEPYWQTRKETGRMPAPPHDETGHTWHHRDELLLAITKFGLAKLTNNPDYQTDMPIYDGVLSDEEIVAVMAYIKAQWPKEIQQRHDQMNAQSN